MQNRLSGAGNEQKAPVSYVFSEKILPQLLEDDELMMPGHFSKEKYEIKVGRALTLDFDCNNPIFQLTEQVLTRNPSKACMSCKKDLSKSNKPQHCHFCGERNCDKCLHKTRQFKPLAQSRSRPN